MIESTSPYLRFADRMIALCEPLRGLDAAGLADRALCLARWQRAGFVQSVGDRLAPDLVEEREACRRAALRLKAFPAEGRPEPREGAAIDARIRFAGLRAFAALDRELRASMVDTTTLEVVHG